MSHRGLDWLLVSILIVVCSGIAHGATIRRVQPPTLLESPATITVDVGSRVAVLCSEPGGTVQWYGPDGEAVVTGDGVQVRGTAFQQILTFTNYQSSQGGQYECRSSRDGGNDAQIVSFVSPEATTEPTPSPVTGKVTQESTTPGATTTSLVTSATLPPKIKVPQKVGAPVLTKAVRSGRPALTVTWTAPQSDHPITKYQVQYRRTGTTSWSTRDVTTRSVTLENLSPGASYQVQVRAVSDVGSGPISDTRVLSTYRVPSPVDIPNVTRAALSGRPALRVSWRAPQSDLPITRYEVQYRVTGSGNSVWRTVQVAGPNPSPRTLSPLVGGTRYDVRVRAVSAVGRGNYSPTRTQTAPKVPSAVDIPTVTQAAVSGRPALRVSWRATQSDLPITRYEVQYRVTGSGNSVWKTVQVIGPNPTSRILSLLVGGTRYDIRVRAVSAVGGGNYSPTTTQTTPRVPSAVDIPTVARAAVSGRPALRVSWRAPQSEFTITRYEVQYRVTGSGNSAWRTVPVTGPNPSPRTLSPLVSGTRYDIRVRAVSAVGEGNYSPTRTQTAPRVPSPVDIPTVTRAVVSGRPALRVLWRAPQSDLTITRYEVQYRVTGSGNSVWKTVPVTGPNPTSRTVSPLVGGTRYDIRVRAVSAVGEGNYSPTQIQTAPRVPSQVTGLSVTQTAVSGRPALRVSWSRPQSDATITGYEVQYRVSNSGSWTTMRVTGASTLTTTLTTLTTGRRYDVQVRAVSSVGNGAYSRVQTQLLDRVPGPVSNLFHSITSNTSAKITWSEPTEPNGVITGYVMEYGVYEGNKTKVNFREDVTATSLKNLTPKRPVQVTVSAKTIIGMGQTVSKIFFPSEGTPTVAVRNIAINWINDNSAVHVSWTPLTLHEARGFPLYVVTYYPTSLWRVSRDTNRVTTTNSSVVIGGLDPTTSYSFMVDVYTGNGTMKGNATAGLHVLLPPGASSDNSGVIAGSISAVAFIFIVIIATVITTICVVIFRKRHSHNVNSSDTAKDVEYESVQLESNPAYGTANIYEEIK